MPEKKHNGHHISLQETRSQEVQEIMGKMPHWMVRSGITLTGLLVLCLFTVAWCFRYPDVVRGHVVIQAGGQAYTATADMPAADTWKIRPGQKVLIRLTAYPYEQYGMLEGTVAAPAGVLTGGNYKVNIQLDDRLLTGAGKVIPGQPGLEGTAEILMEERSILQRIWPSF